MCHYFNDSQFSNTYNYFEAKFEVISDIDFSFLMFESIVQILTIDLVFCS
jgi:hypothetical protein